MNQFEKRRLKILNRWQYVSLTFFMYLVSCIVITIETGSLAIGAKLALIVAAIKVLVVYSNRKIWEKIKATPAKTKFRVIRSLNT